MSVRKFFLLVLAIALFVAQGAAAASFPDFTEMATECGPAVVNIGTERKTQTMGPEDFFGEMFRNMPPGFEKFFDHFGGRGQYGKRPQQRQKSLGSGFLISADGYIVTNNHVVANAETIQVTLNSGTGRGESLSAKLVGSDEESDLALLKVETKKSLPYLAFGDSDALKVGEWLLAIGNPFGLENTVTAGILSAKGRNIHAGPFDNFLQTDASINPGNSGGPLLNTGGQVIGINTAIIASGQGIGFAIPSNMASKIISQIRTGKTVSRGWLGVGIQDVDDNTAKALGMKTSKGALVEHVMENEPAAAAGIKDGDVIIEVDKKSVENASALIRAIADKAPGSGVTLTLWRDSGTIDVKVTLGERKSAGYEAAGKDKTGKDVGLLGLSVRPLKTEERRELKISKNEGIMIIGINPDKPAARVDIRPGDVILKVNLKSVNSAEELSRIVKEEGVKRGAVLLQVARRDDVFFRTVPLEK
ncbi:MAG: DegQ family serine endoprotease [Desulfovibrio sp.]|jgi:serine protease Do|nr:DegQ family serine endoprotease [Desulfovibrio sp.]